MQLRLLMAGKALRWYAALHRVLDAGRSTGVLKLCYSIRMLTYTVQINIDGWFLSSCNGKGTSAGRTDRG